MSSKVIAAPELPYLPRDPRSYRPGIALVGCGAITKHHLAAYRAAAYNVVALCDLKRPLADAHRETFFPRADVYTDYRDLLRRDDVEVVDVATHPPGRPAIIEACLASGRHVLSQKPLVLDLDVGQRLVDVADRHGVLLAVNQNARWAPYFSYLRQAVAAGLVGRPGGLHFAVHWNHNGVAGTAFENVRHLVLYDFAIHWFDVLTCLMPQETPRRVFATLTCSTAQQVRPALLAQALVQYDTAQASLVFDGDTRYGPHERTYVTGDRGTITSEGIDSRNQQVTLVTEQGVARPELAGCWFPDGFHGTMGELLSAVEEGRQPSHGAAGNLAGLALCFAAVASAERGEAVVPGSVRKMPG